MTTTANICTSQKLVLKVCQKCGKIDYYPLKDQTCMNMINKTIEDIEDGFQFLIEVPCNGKLKPIKLKPQEICESERVRA